MIDKNEMKKWIQRRIDYFETKFEMQPKPRDEEDVEERGMLAAFYMVTEFIEGQRR
ncbi:hypothetical protein UFOVP100_21 [uncultured Caudovirales phage]|uniref:Uncharacterized protein n=1 Tax=uncultured Caudovirales phage TaxID=2100421 RepID=A0A6J5L1V3_9CAUD|nr:hypothetical protein UFOVP100_21 [uncultured Caudovirales phage]